MDYLSAAFNFKNSGHWYIDADLKHKDAYTNGKYFKTIDNDKEVVAESHHLSIRVGNNLDTWNA